MPGRRCRRGRARLDHVVSGAAARSIPTVCVGDGGNEIGFGAIRDAVVAHVPHGAALCAASAADVVLPAGVSNWGCYAILAALALIRRDATLAHSAELERRLLAASPMIGLIDGNSGKLEPTADGMDVHVALVTLLTETVRRGLQRDRGSAPS